MMQIMTRAVWTTAATIFLAGAAGAADLPVKAPPPPIPVYDWTGFYLGVNAGIGVGRNPSAFDVLPAFAASRFALSPIGAIGGAQAGYNWQAGNFVFGVEADIQASGQNDNQTCLILCAPVGPPPQFARFDQSIDWFGTVRGRIGYATGPVLVYYTGGFAYGGVTTTITEVLGPGTGTFEFGDTATGWTLGSGVEAALGGNWTGRIEYLYLDLGSDSIAYTFGPLAVPHAASTDIRSHIFRAGLNYRIGGTPAPAYPTANWTGFYVGANVGGGLGRNEAAMAITAVPVDTFTLAPRGFLGGAQVGFNWQTSNIVFGLEADFQGSSLKDDDTCVLFCSVAGGGVRFEQSLPWFGTLRGRIGYAAGPALFYLTGGLAYAKVETDVIQTVGPLVGGGAFDDTKSGWVVGGGIEQPFNLFGLLPGDNWTMKTEYLYADLGSVSGNYNLIGPTSFTTDVTAHIFRTGINYRFGAGPVTARY